MPARWLLSALACLAFLGVAAPARAGEPFRQGSKHVALVGGYGVGFRMGSAQNRRISRELGDVRTAQLIPRFAIGVTDPLGGDAFYRGNIEMLFEGAFLIATEPNDGFGGGVGSSLRYNFLALADAHFVPYLDLNFGVVGIDFDLERQADGFAFDSGAGLGAHWLVSERTALTAEARWQHISNAGTKQENDGINEGLFLLGVTVFLR